MKIFSLSTIALVIMAGSANAATNEQLLKQIRALKAENAALRAINEGRGKKVERKIDTMSKFAQVMDKKPAPLIGTSSVSNWAGFYTGLNAGYAFGTNYNVDSINYGSYLTLLCGSIVDPALSSALSSNNRNTQNGFLGGAQFGYNYPVLDNIIVGVEADIQGSNVSGSTSGRGVGASSFSDNSPPVTGSMGGVVLGSQSIVSGVNYLGTVRGRVGYLITQSLLGYATAGFTYADAYAKITNYAIDSGSAMGVLGNASISAGISQTYYGNSVQSQLLAGWNAGGGFEWLFAPSWSLRTEAIYWNVGNMNIATDNWAVSPLPSASVEGVTIPIASNSYSPSNTRVNYQGVIARAAINYHFKFEDLSKIYAY